MLINNISTFFCTKFLNSYVPWSPDESGSLDMGEPYRSKSCISKSKVFLSYISRGKVIVIYKEGVWSWTRRDTTL